MKSVKVKDVSVNCYQYTEYYYKETRGLYEMHKFNTGIELAVLQRTLLLRSARILQRVLEV